MFVWQYNLLWFSHFTLQYPLPTWSKLANFMVSFSDARWGEAASSGLTGTFSGINLSRIASLRCQRRPSIIMWIVTQCLYRILAQCLPYSNGMLCVKRQSIRSSLYSNLTLGSPGKQESNIPCSSPIHLAMLWSLKRLLIWNSYSLPTNNYPLFFRLIPVYLIVGCVLLALYPAHLSLTRRQCPVL